MRWDVFNDVEGLREWKSSMIPCTLVIDIPRLLQYTPATARDALEIN